MRSRSAHPRPQCPLVAPLLLCLLVAGPAFGQTLQVGGDAKATGANRVRIDYVGYRAARCNTTDIVEPQNERPNQGGLVHVYYTNVSEKPLRLAFWRANGEDESHWLLGGSLAWHRAWNTSLEPGESGILEINAVSPEFGPGKPFSFSWVDRETWRPVGGAKTDLVESPVQIALIRVMAGMRDLEVHIRNGGEKDVRLESVDVMRHPADDVQWAERKLDAGTNSIARLKLKEPLQPSEYVVVRLDYVSGGETRCVYAHRRAFEDEFPIGVWTATPDTYQLLRRLHVDTVIEGGAADNEFYSQAVPRYGFRTIASTGMPVDVDSVRSLSGHPALRTWMLRDEPDWSIEPNVMLFVDDTVRKYDSTRPTFITLCRNVKFFEYASICDIPCMDHYSVTAPSSSKWPHPYGTRLEETAIYTEDLKAASEPKPIWVWSQAIASWDQRPKRPVPTPDELAAQLLLNLGRGAKGIIWFNYEHEVGEKFQDTRQAMQDWGRVMRLARANLLGAEPYDARVKTADKIDAASLASWDSAVLCITNLDYQIDPEAYPFKLREDVRVEFTLPSWIDPKCAIAVEPGGVREVPFKVRGNRATVEAGDIKVGTLILLDNNPAFPTDLQKQYQAILHDEHKEY